MRGVLGRIIKPDICDDDAKPYEWSDIDELEAVLDQAANLVVESDRRVQDLRGRFQMALMNRSAVLGEGSPSLMAAAQRAASFDLQSVAQGLSARARDAAAEQAIKFDELKDQDQAEVAGILARSVGRAAVEGTRGAYLGLKAVVDGVVSAQVAEAARKARDESAGIVGNLEGVKVESADDIKDLVKSDKVRGSLRSTEATLGYIGEAARAIWSNARGTKSAQMSEEALRESSKDLASAANAFAALTSKGYEALRRQADPGGDDGMEVEEGKSSGEERERY